MDSDEVFGMNVEHRLQFKIHTKNLEKIKSQLQSKKEKAISSEPDGGISALQEFFFGSVSQKVLQGVKIASVLAVT